MVPLARKMVGKIAHKQKKHKLPLEEMSPGKVITRQQIYAEVQLMQKVPEALVWCQMFELIHVDLRMEPLAL